MVVNSIAAQEFGSDYTDLFGVRGVSGSLRIPFTSSFALTFESAFERQRMLFVNATPASGSYEHAAFAVDGDERRATLAVDRPTRLGLWGFETQLHADVSVVSFIEQPPTVSDSLFQGRIISSKNFVRLTIATNLEKPIGRQRLVLRSFEGFVIGNDISQYLVHLGGPISGPGYDYHQFRTNGGGSHRFELQTPVPFVSIPLGRYGKTPASLTLAPFASVIWKHNPARDAGSSSDDRWNVSFYPSVGVGVLSIFDLVRFDVARGVNNGRWTFNVDVARDFWRIL